MQIDEQEFLKDDDSAKSPTTPLRGVNHDHRVQIFNKNALFQEFIPTIESHQPFSSYSGTRNIGTP
jgi:hypothetical protein